MPAKKEPSGRRSVEAQAEVPSTPEAWQAWLAAQFPPIEEEASSCP